MTAANTTLRILELAERHAGRNPSAAMALSDARINFVTGDYRNAGRRAVASLKHSVGILDPDYATAEALQLAQVPR
jgi:hypothetical protein